METNKREKELIANLLSSDKKIVLKALKDVRHDGAPTIIPTLIEVLANPISQDVKDDVLKVLYSLKDNNCVPFIIEALQNPSYTKNHGEIAAALWEAGLNVDDRLEELVNIAIKGDFQTTLEITTVIENIDGGFPYDEVTEAVLSINEYIEESEDDTKNALLFSLAQVLNEMIGN